MCFTPDFPNALEEGQGALGGSQLTHFIGAEELLPAAQASRIF